MGGNSASITDADRVRLTVARDWLIANADKYPNFEQAAQLAQFSPFHFHRRFKLCFGTTPKRIVFEYQIEKAKQLMLGGAKLDQVAKLSGFAHASHFCSRFKRAVGQTPTEWLCAARRQD